MCARTNVGAYRFETNTADAEGEQVGESMEWRHVTEEGVLEACTKFVGNIMQEPPIFSVCLGRRYAHVHRVIISRLHSSIGLCSCERQSNTMSSLLTRLCHCALTGAACGRTAGL